MGAEKLKEKMEAFNRSKQGFEESKAATLIRRGRIDVFDEVRSALSNWWDSLGQEKELIGQMQEMFECLHDGIKRAIKNEEEYAPTEDPRVSKEYNEALRDLLERAVKDGDYTDDGFGGNFGDTKYNQMNSKISNDPELQEKATKVAENRKKTGLPTSGPNKWAKMLAHEIKTKGDAEREIKKAKNEISKLSGGKNKAMLFQESMASLKLYDDKLRRFNIKLFWAERDTDEQMERVSRVMGSSSSSDSDSDKKKHEKKLIKIQRAYAILVNEALDTLIDLRESVDSDDQTKVITPREKNIYLGLQKFTSKDWNLIREAEKKAAQASAG